VIPVEPLFAWEGILSREQWRYVTKGNGKGERIFSVPSVPTRKIVLVSPDGDVDMVWQLDGMINGPNEIWYNQAQYTELNQMLKHCRKGSGYEHHI
jgi:hypothetical protein